MIGGTSTNHSPPSSSANGALLASRAKTTKREQLCHKCSAKDDFPHGRAAAPT